MEHTDHQPDSADRPDPDQLPFVAPCNRLPLFAAFEWMSLGWQDFRAAPGVSLIYGGMLVLISYLLAMLGWYLGGPVLLISLLSGFVFVAPALALGLYSVSCQIGEGHSPKLAYCFREGKRHLGNELIFSFVLLVIFLVWVRAGSGLHIFFPIESSPQLREYLLFYGIGSVVGAIFASIVFCASAFALPMLMDRETDAITAVVTSVNAVLKNKLPMLVWAGCIVAILATCMLTGFLAMVVLMPLVGYATWHGYRQTINAELWQEHLKLNEQKPRVDQLQQ